MSSQTPGTLNYADMMTKPLGPSLLKRFVKGLRLCELHEFTDVLIGVPDANGVIYNYAVDGLPGADGI